VACVESIPGLSDESSHIPFFAFGRMRVASEEGRQEREGTRGVGLGYKLRSNSAMSSSLVDFSSSQLLLVDRSPQVSFSGHEKFLSKHSRNFNLFSAHKYKCIHVMSKRKAGYQYCPRNSCMCVLVQITLHDHLLYFYYTECTSSFQTRLFISKLHKLFPNTQSYPSAQQYILL
jgi:hypothetical protein